MTLKECIALTIKKHPDYNCKLILKAYFRINNGFIPSDGMVNLRAFSSEVDAYKPREAIKNLGREGVIASLERETNMQARKVGLVKLIEEYSARFYKNNDKTITNIIRNDCIVVNVNNINELKKIIDILDSLGYTDDVKERVLCNSYEQNSNIERIINEANEDFNQNHSILLGEDTNTKIKNFLKYINNYFGVISHKNYMSQVENNSKKLDEALKLNLDDNLKVDILINLFYGNDTDFSDILPNIEKENVMIALIRNAIQASLVSINMRDRSREEYILYNGVKNPEEVLIQINNIIKKLLVTDFYNYYSNITKEELSQTINNLNYLDVQFLSRLYLQTRRNSNCVKILENAQNRLYKIEDENQIGYENLCLLLKILNSKEFFNTLNSSYYK